MIVENPGNPWLTCKKRRIGPIRCFEFGIDLAYNRPYNQMRIDWDPQKAAANLRDHGVAFAEAATVLLDDFALTREVPDSIDEQRFVTLGVSAAGDLLVVVYAHREPDHYRLISSWKANRRQRKQYEEARS